MPASFRHFPVAALVCLFAPVAPAQEDAGLRLSAKSLRAVGTVGGPTTQQLGVLVTSGEPGCTVFEVVGAEVPWLTITPRAANAPATVYLTVDYSSFASNEERSATVIFAPINTPPNASYCLDTSNGIFVHVERLEISAKLLPAGPRPVPNPDPLVMELNDESGLKNLISAPLVVANSGNGTLSYGFEIAYSGSQIGWLSVSPSGGSISNFEPQAHQVTANALGVPAGTHRAFLRLSHNAPDVPIITIPVTFTTLGPPKLSATPEEITATAKRGKENPAPTTLSVRNSGGGTLNYQVSTSASWLTVTPAAGEAAGSTAKPHTVAFNTAGLAPGPHEASVTISANVAGGPLVIPVRLDVEPGGTFSIAPGEALVTAAAGSSEPRQIRFRLESPGGDALQWRARVDPPSVQWLRLMDRGGSLPSMLVAEVDPAAIPRPVLLSAAIVIEAFDPNDVAALSAEGGSPAQSADAIIRTIVPLRLRTVTQEPRLSTAPPRIELVAAAGSGPRIQPISISMSGGSPALPWQATLVQPGGAFRVFPSAGSGPGSVTVTGDPTGLGPGVYTADVLVSGGGAEQIIPVAMLVAREGEPVLTTGQTAVALRGSAAMLPADIRVSNLAGDAPSIEVRPTTLAGGSWLEAVPTASGALRAQAHGAGMTPGLRHGLLEILSPGAGGAGQFLPILFEREAPGSPADLVLDRGGLVFTDNATQTVAVRTTTDSAAEISAGVSTEAGAQWLRVTPSSGLASAGSPWTVSVRPDLSLLGAGVHRGRVTLAIAGGATQSIEVTLVLPPAASCESNTIVLAPLAPPAGFRAIAGHPVTVEAGLLDNCGFPVQGGIAVPGAIMRDMGAPAGQIRGPRIFRGTVALPEPGEATLLFRAAADDVRTAERRVTVSVSPEQAPLPPGFAAPLVHAATFSAGRPLAPGAIATLFGTGFPAPAQQPSTAPLPESLDGFSVRIGGRPAPLFFLSSTQANLQVPAETPSNTLVQSLVRVGDAYLSAESFFTSEAQPGVFTHGRNRAVAINPDGALNTPEAPARRKETVVVYLAGLGPTAPATLTGHAAPAEPLARAALSAYATIGGAPAEVVFAGLTPGLVGLAQANLTISSTAATGADVPLVLEIGGYRTPETLLAVEP